MAFVSALNYVKMTFDYIFCTDGKSQKKTASAIAASEQPLLLLAQKDKEDVRLKMGNDCVKFMALGQPEEEEEGSFSSAHSKQKIQNNVQFHEKFRENDFTKKLHSTF